jgi:hypothetical protein
MTQEAHDREYRVIDQMISMHAYIAQNKKRQATLLGIGLLLASAILCAFTFADDATMALFGIGAVKARFVMGLASAVVFGFSIVELKVDWRGVAQAHDDAARRLSTLKAKYRRVQASLDTDKRVAWGELSKEYAETLDSIVTVPERSFTHLKARHLFKIELSRAIDKNPGVPATVLVLVVRLRATWNYVFRGQSNIEQNEHPPQ